MAKVPKAKIRTTVQNRSWGQQEVSQNRNRNLKENASIVEDMGISQLTVGLQRKAMRLMLLVRSPRT